MPDEGEKASVQGNSDRLRLFPIIYYFCKVFKEYYGMSPTQYRFENN